LNMQTSSDRAASLMTSLHGLSAKTDATNKQILDAAHKRLDVVAKQMQALAPHVFTQHGAEDEYQKLALESRQLNVVIGHCSFT
jgi:hypothetical protein